jgi:hypothetical protein
VGLNQIKQCFPRQHLLHLVQKSLALGSLPRGGLLVITESELLAACEPSPRLRLHGYFARMVWVFQGLFNYTK